MQVRVLGCSGGVGVGLRTTSLLLDDDILIDCGTGVGDLSMAELQRIRHVFITHAHLDHICMLPLLVDTIFDDLEGASIQVHASKPVLAVLRKHIFNWQVWPDFFALPDKKIPVLIEAPLENGDTVEINGRCIEALPVEHSVPALGYLVTGEQSKVLAFSGDTGSGVKFWEALNARKRLDYLIVECAYAETERALAEKARHYYPASLARDFSLLEHAPEVFITHLKPACEAAIIVEIAEKIPSIPVRRLQIGHVFTL